MASNMINALKESSWLKSAEHDENYDCIYSVFPACRLDFGRGLQTRRLDVLVAENLTETNRNSVALRGIAIKNSKYELAIDVNSAEFIEFVYGENIRVVTLNPEKYRQHIFRFSLNKATSREIERNELWDHEISALIAVGQHAKALALAQTVYLSEERLKCFLIIARKPQGLSADDQAMLKENIRPTGYYL